ncbi:MAG: hypothetical protein AVDCRST_MAG76-2010 [uncultured Acidimicrobiales bacterium]|uniref:Uncharacterized protein n=1 Tax=uncultured Acidimicrobiales bacterium TaxID=310071 RepID=A0A6J4IAL7_9ACTN|nr:MAG: hypothetical protein AVDCRST_MAG76-2010 [uncultured Acidimicrobiales bacterium]
MRTLILFPLVGPHQKAQFANECGASNILPYRCRASRAGPRAMTQAAAPADGGTGGAAGAPGLNDVLLPWPSSSRPLPCCRRSDRPSGKLHRWRR